MTPMTRMGLQNLSGSRTRLACWFRRRAETVYYSDWFAMDMENPLEKFAIARTRSPAREARTTQPACAWQESTILATTNH